MFKKMAWMCEGDGAGCIGGYGKRYREAWNRQQLGWREEYIVVSYLQLEKVVMEGGLDVPGGHRTMESKVRK